MEPEPRTVRLESLFRNQPPPLEDPQPQKYLNHTKNSLTSNFKFSSNRPKLKTEPSNSSIHSSVKKEVEKQDSSFSEEYLSLVNKLRVNLSKEYFKKNNKKNILKEREMYYNDENYQRQRNFSLNNKPRIIAPLSNRKLSNFSQQTKSFKSTPKNLQEQTFHPNQPSRIIQLTKLNLVKDNKQTKKSNHSNQVLHHLSKRQNESEQQSSYQRKLTKKDKYFVLKQQRKKLLTHISAEPVQQHADINKQYSQAQELIFHLSILLDIYQLVSNYDKDISYEMLLLKAAKGYILGNKKVVQGLKEGQNMVVADDICHLEMIFKSQQAQKDLKNFIFLERILIILTIDLISTQKLRKYLTDIKSILENIIGLYLYLTYALHSEKYIEFQAIQQSVHLNNIHLKKQLAPLIIFLHKKFAPLIKSNNNLGPQIKILIGEFEHRNISINRAFYELLKLYAIYLNHHDYLLDHQHSIMKTFATCPSPYLTKPSNKHYTLVLDLDQTLLHVRESKNKISLFLRPFAKQFLELMGLDFQIVVFTSSLPSHSQDIINTLPQISHRLYRYHTTRLKSRHVKDLARIGRPLSRTIIIDNQPQNFILQPQNGIKIYEWTGDNPSDQELNILGCFLKKLVEENHEDVRIYLTGYKEFRRQYF